MKHNNLKQSLISGVEKQENFLSFHILQNDMKQKVIIRFDYEA